MADRAQNKTRGAPRRGPGVVRRALRRPGGAAGGRALTAFVVLGVLGPTLAPSDPFAIAGPSLAAPSAVHPMGTDALGRDLWSGILFGARTSLFLSLGVGALVFLMGCAIGGTAGYRGGWVDDVLMRATEVVHVVPRFFLAILAIALLGPGVGVLVLVLGLTSWTMLARVVRAEVLTLREREFVLAARASGASETRILWSEVLPNALPTAVALLGLILGRVLLIEAGLGFLGLGDPNGTSWGFLAAQAQPYLRVAWWLALFPGLAIVLAVLAFNLLGDALTETTRQA